MWNFFKRKTNQVSAEDDFKVYLDFELSQFKAFTIDEYTTSQDLCQKLIKFLPVSSSTNFNRLLENFNQNFSIVFGIRHLKSNSLISRRKLNSFEFPSRIYKLKPKSMSGFEYVFVYQQTDATKKAYESDFIDYKEGELPSNEIHSSTSEKYEMAGNLMKRTKNGTFKEKYFILEKDHLRYFRPKEKVKKIVFIPLEFAIVERIQNGKDKYMFQIKSTDKIYQIKVKTDIDMRGWIKAINSQVVMVTENKILNEFDKKICSNEKKYNEETRKDIESLFKSFDKVLADDLVSAMFYEFLSTFHPEEMGLINLLNLYNTFKSFLVTAEQKEAFRLSKIIFEALSSAIYNFELEKRNQIRDFEQNRQALHEDQLGEVSITDSLSYSQPFPLSHYPQGHSNETEIQGGYDIRMKQNNINIAAEKNIRSEMDFYEGKSIDTRLNELGAAYNRLTSSHTEEVKEEEFENHSEEGNSDGNVLNESLEGGYLNNEEAKEEKLPMINVNTVPEKASPEEGIIKIINSDEKVLNSNTAQEEMIFLESKLEEHWIPVVQGALFLESLDIPKEKNVQDLKKQSFLSTNRSTDNLLKPGVQMNVDLQDEGPKDRESEGLATLKRTENEIITISNTEANNILAFNRVESFGINPLDEENRRIEEGMRLDNETRKMEEEKISGRDDEGIEIPMSESVRSEKRTEGAQLSKHSSSDRDLVKMVSSESQTPSLSSIQYKASNSNVTIPEELDIMGKGKTTLTREEERMMRREHSTDERKQEINVYTVIKQNENNLMKLSTLESEIIGRGKYKDLFMAEFHEDFFTKILDEMTWREIKIKYEYMKDIFTLTELTEQIQDIYNIFIQNLRKYLEETYYKPFLESEFFLRRVTKLSLMRFKRSFQYRKPVFSDLKKNSIMILPNKMLSSVENPQDLLSSNGNSFSMNASRKRMVSTVFMPNFFNSQESTNIKLTKSEAGGLARLVQSEKFLAEV